MVAIGVVVAIDDIEVYSLFVFSSSFSLYVTLLDLSDIDSALPFVFTSIFMKGIAVGDKSQLPDFVLITIGTDVVAMVLVAPVVLVVMMCSVDSIVSFVVEANF